jgi:hypothetical protein
VIDWPPYFALIAAACGTFGAAIAAAARVVVAFDDRAEATLSETSKARREKTPAMRTN